MLGIWRAAQFGIMGLKHFTKDGYKFNSKKFDNSTLERDLKGYVCFVTGANQGIGYQASLELAKRNATLYMVCRSRARGEEAVAKIKELSGNQDVFLKVCDISSLEQIRSLASEVDGENVPCHVLVNNAGCMRHNALGKSADGYEVNFATNTLGTFALTALLMNALKRAAKSTVGSARVVMVSSGGMYTEGLEVDDLQMEKPKRFDAVVQYARDKRRQVAVAEKFSKLFTDSGVKFVSMHPGWTGTEGVKEALPGFSKQMSGKLRSLEEGSDTIVWLALEDPCNLTPGGFYFDRKLQKKHLFWAGTSYRSSDVDRLWSRLCHMAGLQELEGQSSA
uniref:Dehydrogenase reductase sdr family member 12-like n=1 Tax=Tetraselmis sp. GSL018 TaxID=582737 RepID=A0A061RP24_9CHLO|mmetsp:Transcript_14508/g.34438  ORF Transcript_14508/g.34438 Transcript_14508/m.34438 type:complete len:335 (-) Transcript_14508:1877-2881(-)